MASSFDLPSAILRPTKAWVFLSVRSRLIAIMCRARLAWRSPPRLSRCRLVLPDDAGSGEVPQSMAQAASERSRSGLSPAVTSSWPAVSMPMQGRSRSLAPSSTIGTISFSTHTSKSGVSLAPVVHRVALPVLVAHVATAPVRQRASATAGEQVVAPARRLSRRGFPARRRY